MLKNKSQARYIVRREEEKNEEEKEEGGGKGKKEKQKGNFNAVLWTPLPPLFFSERKQGKLKPEGFHKGKCPICRIFSYIEIKLFHFYVKFKFQSSKTKMLF